MLSYRFKLVHLLAFFSSINLILTFFNVLPNAEKIDEDDRTESGAKIFLD